MPAVDPIDLPFNEQIAFFRDKAKVTTQAYTDIFNAEHNHAFMVAGANTADLVNDFHRAVQKAIVDGTTLEDFRRDFDVIVAKNGWAYNGGRNWRTQVIYDTNLRQSYNAGREAQMADPELRKLRPYGRYVHSDSVQHPRPLHLSWNNMVLPLDDPWWDSHTPQNGWGCRCQKQMLSAGDVAGMGLSVADQAPAIHWQEVTVGTQGPSPRTVMTPEGIDPGFAYRPGSYRTLQMLGKTATLPPSIAADYFSAVKKTAIPGVIAEGTRWMNSILADPRMQHRSATIWAMDKQEMDFFSARGISPVRADITLDDKQVLGAKRVRHDAAGNALSDVEWAQLPVMIATRRMATLYDNQTGHMLYVLQPLGVDDRAIKVVVDVDFIRKNRAGPEAVTVFKVPKRALTDKNRYAVVTGEIK